ncbi:fibrohexamerin-like [Spodoptera frugiperda]|uniref:Fibrohexamerin-like n=1 Tax=Spodoptera frugiperda TaxID=7108 RepID=A0A9R0DRM8_SPOFR|nr:fibrohexamerin-like [Spodoptera frugiperda]
MAGLGPGMAVRLNPHHEQSIVTPCSIHDVNCIRGFFAYNTQCSITGGSAPDPYIPDKIYLPTPHANLTFTLNNPRIKGLNNWKIKEFYINKATGVLVMEVEFSSIVVQTPKCVVTYYRKGKESLETADFTEIEYKDLSMTLSIPDLKDPQLSGAHVYTYVADGKPKYTLGPGIYKTKDPGFQRALIDVESKVDISLVEIFVTQGPIFFSKFFQSSICDIAHY